MSHSTPQSEAIAIIGLAGRFPGARNLDEFWRNLRDGVESVSFFTDEELEGSPLEGPPPLGHPGLVRARALIERPEWFDAAFFGYNPKEAELMDPQQRILLECAWEALEHAGCNPESYPGLIGVFAGASFNTYFLGHVLPNREAVRHAGGLQVMLAGDKDFLTTRISYKLNLRGPSLNVQTACSTSLVAVALACQNLLGRQCDIALAGGVSVSFPQRKASLHQEGGIISPDGHCRAFDASAAGTVSGDGAGLVVLKRLSDALADGDHVCAVIRGSAINNDGSAKIGYTAPGIDGQAEVIALAHAQADVEPETITYVEAHGTGTPLGDPIEVAGLVKAFAAETTATGFCALGTVKSNIGHLDVAAGIAGLIKTVLALQHRQIPPTLHFQRPNPGLELDGSPFYVNDRLRDWPAREGTPRRAGVSSFGLGGTNAHVVLEEAPAPRPADPGRPRQLLVLSARTPGALAAATANLAARLEAQPELELADVAWTLQNGRKAFPHRRALVCRDRADAIRALRGSATPAGAAKAAPVAFLFPGQGAQQVDMAREIYDTEPVFRRELDRCCEILKSHFGGLDLRPILYPAPENRAAAEEQLRQTGFAQPVLFAVEYALARLWMSWGIRPCAMIGHSLGEYVAACLAEVFSLETALAVVATRARLMQRQPAGVMLAVRLAELEVLPLLGRELSLAAVNAPELCVVSGPAGAIAALEETLAARSVAGRRLATSHAFHSASMEPAAAALATEMTHVHPLAPQIPYLSNVTGQWITVREAADPAYWGSHLRRTVRFADGLGELFRESSPILLEVGPGQTLTQLARQHPAVAAAGSVVVASLEPSAKTGEHQALLHALGRLWTAGAGVDWAGHHEGTRRTCVPLPTYPFERQRHWIEARSWEATGASRPSDPAPLPANAPAAPPAGAPDPSAAPAENTVLTELRALFRELSGLDLDGANTTASFAELGFDSLFLTQAALAVRERFGVHLAFRELLGRFSTLEKLAAHLAASAAPPAPRTAPAPAGAGGGPRTVPLTEAQREIWFATQLGTAVSAAYNESCTVHLHGPFDPAVLNRALTQLAARHEALRTTFSADGERQHIAPAGPVAAAVTDLTGAPAASREMMFRGQVDRAIQKPFDLVNGPLWRVRLVRLADEHHVVVLIVHHLICDGWSLHILIYELGELYSALREGRAAALPVAEQLGDYARQDAERHQTPEFKAAETYWLAQFADTVPVLDLPADRPRPAVRTYAGDHQGRKLSPEVAAAVRRLATAHGCTVFTVLLAGFHTLLHRLSGQDDLVVGVPAAAQVLGGRETLVGHCINLLPVRSRLGEGQGFGDFLAATRDRVFGAFEHWQHPFGALLRRLNVARDPNRVPLASVTFNYGRLRGALRFAGTEPAFAVSPKRFVNFDLGFNVTEADGTFLLDCHYSTELFAAATIGHAFDRYELLLATAAQDPARPVHRLPLLTAAETQLLAGWNRTTADYPRSQCLHELFEDQARRTPQAVALVGGDERWTYRRLNERANQFAHQLLRLGVKPETPVALCGERTPAMIAGLLGILKAGGAYVPLDPAYPRERLAFMLQDSGAGVLLTGRARRFDPPLAAPGTVVRELDLDDPGLDRESRENPAHRPAAGNLAYVIYTSGSTGRPKGVAIEHRSAVALLHWALGVYSPAELRGVLAATSLCFDLSVFEIFLPLAAGGTVILADNALQLPALPARDEVTLVNTVPSAITELLRVQGVPASVRTVNLAGEPLAVEVVRQLYALPHVQKVYDLYGPSEDTTYSTFALRLPDGPATIGRPIANTQVLLLDRHLEPVPPGAPGELCLAGDGLARGYLNQPELTRQKFVPHPQDGTPGARLYRTGDLARHRPDGNLEFLGRLDHQVKIRGHRIELGEIEAALLRHHGVRECVVVVREDAPGDRRLAAYFVPREGVPPTGAELRPFLARQLPEPMVPAAFVPLERLPLTPSGKLDRRALPAPAADRPALPGRCTAPRTTTEEVLAAIWREVLGRTEVGVHDNFFELGGHSLLVTQVVVRVQQAFQIQLPLRRAFDAPTIAGLALVIEDALAADIRSLELDREDHARLVG